MKIDHIGIAVSNLSRYKDIFSDILARCSVKSEKIEMEKIELASFDLNGVEIEFFSPTEKDSKIAKFLEGTKGGAIHHIALRVVDLAKQISFLAEKGYEVIAGFPSKGKDGSQVAFLHPKKTGGILIELVQKD